ATTPSVGRRAVDSELSTTPRTRLVAAPEHRVPRGMVALPFPTKLRTCTQKARTNGQLVTTARRRHGPDRVDQAAEGLDACDAARSATPRLAHRVLHPERSVGALRRAVRPGTTAHRRGRRGAVVHVRRRV